MVCDQDKNHLVPPVSVVQLTLSLSNKQTVVYEKVQKQNTARDQFRQVVPPSHAPRCLLVVAHSVTSISLVTLNCLMHKHKQSGIVP